MAVMSTINSKKSWTDPWAFVEDVSTLHPLEIAPRRQLTEWLEANSAVTAFYQLLGYAGATIEGLWTGTTFVPVDELGDLTTNPTATELATAAATSSP